MHILFVLDTWGLIGGTERHAAVIVPALLERGHRVTVLCRAQSGEGFAPVPVLERPELEGEVLEAPARRALRSVLADVRADVVFHSALRNVDAAELLLETAPVVRYVHDHTVFCPGLNKVREDGSLCREPMGAVCLEQYFLSQGCICFKKQCFVDQPGGALQRFSRKQRELALAREARSVLTNSHYMREELLAVGFHPERTRVLYYFTRSNTPDQPQGALPAETERFLAATSGPLLFTPARLTLPDKGVDYLISALAALAASATGAARDFRAVVAGSGPAEPWLREKARLDGLAERLHFTGWLGSSGIEQLYSRSDAVVCPSVWNEPFGLVGIEAMAHARPVVAFRVGGIPEWLDDGETGMLVEPRDHWAMAQALRRLLEQPGLARRLGDNGRRSLERRFPREQHVDGLEAALLAATARSAAA